VPTNFTSKIVSNTETSDVTMVLDEGSVRELAATPPPSQDRVSVPPLIVEVSSIR
jgi:hypothetical protein